VWRAFIFLCAGARAPSPRSFSAARAPQPALIAPERGSPARAVPRWERRADGGTAPQPAHGLARTCHRMAAPHGNPPPSPEQRSGVKNAPDISRLNFLFPVSCFLFPVLWILLWLPLRIEFERPIQNAPRGESGPAGERRACFPLSGRRRRAHTVEAFRGARRFISPLPRRLRGRVSSLVFHE